MSWVEMSCHLTYVQLIPIHWDVLSSHICTTHPNTLRCLKLRCLVISPTQNRTSHWMKALPVMSSWVCVWEKVWVIVGDIEMCCLHSVVSPIMSSWERERESVFVRVRDVRMCCFHRVVSSILSSWHSDEHTATHCNTLQHTTPAHFNIPHTAHGNTLHHAATRCNTLQYTCTPRQPTATHCNLLQRTATQQHATVANIMNICIYHTHNAKKCSTLQHIAKDTCTPR